MSSRRFPGKVLAPFRGKPLIEHVLEALARGLPLVPVVVATSTEESDDPLAAYLRSANVDVFRGPLDHVFERFRMCAEKYPCQWILRVSADSPLLDRCVLQAVVGHAGARDLDLVTTIFPRTFPRGHNAELIRVETFMRIEMGGLSPADQEHVTPVYYRNRDRFRIVNVESGDPRLAELSLAVDSVEDLYRLEEYPGGPTRQVCYGTLLSRAC